MAPALDKDYVLKTVEERDVHFVRFWFTDVLGVLKSLRRHRQRARGRVRRGHGLRRLLDRRLHPHRGVRHGRVSRTRRPSRCCRGVPSEQGVGRMFCDITKPDGKPFEGDPRYALKRMLKKAADMGYTMYVGPELEFFYFADDQEHRGPRQGRLLRPDAARRRERPAPRDRAHAREDGHPGRVLAPRGRPVAARDRPALLRRADDGRQRHDLPPRRQGDRVRRTACTPRSCRSRSSARTARACTCTSRCSPRTATRSSTPTIPRATTSREIAKHYIAGLLKYAPEFCAVTNPFVNSYKRLVPGYEAPVYVAWARRNRSAHGPRADVQARQGGRDPHRAALAGPLVQPVPRVRRHARRRPEGHRGGARRSCPRPRNNIFHMTEAELEAAGIKTLPKDLGEAIELFEQSETDEGDPRRAHPRVLRARTRRPSGPSTSCTSPQWELDKYLSII